MNVVFGAGQSGQAVARALLAAGQPVRLVSRSGAAFERAEVRSADASDPQAAVAASVGATTIFACLGAPYTRWPELFPAMQAGVAAAARATGARLVVLENLYAYGPVADGNLHEALPLAAIGAKGRTRAALSVSLLDAHQAGELNVAIARASDFWGPGVRESALGTQSAGAACKGAVATVMGDPDQPHSFAYMPDLGRNLVELSGHAQAYGKVWHLPHQPPCSMREMLERLAAASGKTLRLRTLGPGTLRAIGLFVPVVRELRETEHQFAGPWLVDDSAWRASFPVHQTEFADAVARTAAWFAGSD